MRCNFCKQEVRSTSREGIFQMCSECKDRYYRYGGTKKSKQFLKSMEIGTRITPAMLTKS